MTQIWVVLPLSGIDLAAAPLTGRSLAWPLERTLPEMGAL